MQIEGPATTDIKHSQLRDRFDRRCVARARFELWKRPLKFEFLLTY